MLPTPMNPARAQPPLGDRDIERLQRLLDGVPPPLEPLDLSALDGYLCGVLLQPQAVAASAWLPGVCDHDARPLPPGFDAAELHALVLRRHAEIALAIQRRDWFDPWVFELEDATSVSESVLPWVAGFAAAQERFPDLLARPDAELIEPLALLYLHFDTDDLEDARVLLAEIETIEPPADLADAVQDLVRAVMLIADVSLPQRQWTNARSSARANVRGAPKPSPRRGHRGRSF